LIPQAKDRQIYKLLYPFAITRSIKQLNFITRAHLIDPLLANNYENLRGPNNYSMLFMGLGQNIYLSDEDTTT
jgi:hypothetical protein